MPTPSPVDKAEIIVTLSITIGGSPIPDYYPVISVNISHEVNKISYAELVFADGDMEKGTFPISDSANFAPGGELEIKAGYGDEADQSIFKGLIVKQGIQISLSGYHVVLTCKHKAVQMTYVKKEQEYSASTDSSIINTIVGTYGLSATVKSTSVTQEFVFQKLATDWDFILSRAEFYGYIITLDGDAITIAEPKVDGAAVLRVAMGESINNFTAELSAEKQATSITASAWDPKNLALLTVTAAEPTVNTQGNLTPKQLSGKLSQAAMALNSNTPMANDELQAWADGSLLRMRLGSIKGEVSFQGSALVKPGTILELDGVGERYNGSAFVTAVNHLIEEGTWLTTTKFGLDSIPIAEKPNFSYPVAAGQLPAIHGLQVGTVKKLFDDPDGQYRIQVTLSSNASTQTGVWARMANFYSSSSIGATFLPEVGDEVVVGFLESNPRYPVILGSLYSSGRQIPTPPADNNNYIKAILTKSKLKVSFDDEKKITKIETPGNNSITLSDDAKSIEIVDQNGNSIKMTSSGIDITSGKDINLKATGNITLNATGKLNLQATQDTAITGMNVTATAQMGITAKGNATAELSASGQTTVKGGIVMIN
ncbi:type VI secretion system tip protein VgrG [Mucilaginibacter sp. HMF5004]|uniref:type VI secretion system tip protein VgrG n=1 Tax=Mucilaginibacter rivuli TaxID=2857527 RepID=UPI001C5DA88B|nr:type VI secretion system tip protein VgrG [Mucilaginibacter rivuli]MBW4891593.1 type VI secretion system tip protein VgrG [Mucilaginibacter rivuli]